MEIKLDNEKTYKYGKVVSDGDYDHGYFNFMNGKQLVGIHGQVIPDDTGDSFEKLMVLGFFRDECSATKELYANKDIRMIVED